MSTTWVFGAEARPSAKTVAAWRKASAAGVAMRGLPRGFGSDGVPKARIGDRLKAWSKRAARTRVECKQAGAKLIIAGWSDGPNVDDLVCWLGAIDALARAGVEVDAYMASAEGDPAFSLTFGKSSRAVRLRGDAATRALGSGPLLAAAGLFNRCLSEAGVMERPKRPASSHPLAGEQIAARKTAAKLFQDPDAGFEALASIRGRAARETAVTNVLGWVTSGVGSAKSRKLVRADPRWVAVAREGLGLPWPATTFALEVLGHARDRESAVRIADAMVRRSLHLVEACKTLAKLGDPAVIPTLEAYLPTQTLPWMRAAIEKTVKALRK